MDSSQSSEDSSSMLSSDDNISSILEYEAEKFEPPPVFTELLELTTYDDGVQVKYVPSVTHDCKMFLIGISSKIKD